MEWLSPDSQRGSPATMTRLESAGRFSSIPGSSTAGSLRASSIAKPLPSTPTDGLDGSLNRKQSAASQAYGDRNNHEGHGVDVHVNGRAHRSATTSSRQGPLRRPRTESNGNGVGPPARSFRDSEPQLSSTSPSATTRDAPLPSSSATPNPHPPARDNRIGDLANYRRDLAVLDPSAGARPSPPQHSSSSSSAASHQLGQIAPWMTSNGGAGPAAPSGTGDPPTSFYYNDSNENLAPLSPSLRPTAPRPSQATTASSESPDASYFNDDRRPSIASVTTTASSQGSKASRGGFKKLQGFFGEEFPGRDSSDVSLPPAVPAKEQRSYSYSQPRPTQRDRNYSNATDHTRDPSPTSSRPRTPVPAPEVVPFLYQEAEDIARYGEAPVRDILSGPDRERYMSESSAREPPKTSSSSRSGHSLVHLPGHSHRHNKSIEDARALRPSVSREDSVASAPNPKERNGSTTAALISKSRPPSPTSSSGKNASSREPTSPGHAHHHRKGILNRLRRNHKEKDDSPAASTANSLKSLPSSTHSLAARPPRPDNPRTGGPEHGLPFTSEWPGPAAEYRDYQQSSSRPGQAPRQQTFNNKFPFSKKGRSHRHHDDADEHIGPTDKNDGGTLYALDTNLNDMEGILGRPLPLAPMNPDSFVAPEGERMVIGSGGPNGAWNAPDSWAVRRTDENVAAHVPDVDDAGSPPRPEEKLTPYCIRVFRSDGTFATLQMSLDATVQDVVSQIMKKSYVADEPTDYNIVLKKHDLLRVLGSQERPLLIQKRLLQQVGYEERDRIEDIGREDNSYLCRFLFLSARESDFHAVNRDPGFGRMQKFNHVDLSGRNLITIPISLYSKAPEIISLNLSRNLSLDLPRDFIQSCQNLRDIKYNNNEARRLPLSLGRASRLTYLDVSNNRLEQLEHAELNGLTGLLKLNLANNRLKHLPPSFSAYKALRTLNISSNFLEKFPVFLCELESLVDLDLSFNLIGTLPEEIGNLSNLEKFVITNNRLSGTLPESFSRLRSLRELDIKYNAITSIDVISELPKLEILAADHNAISRFSGSFERIRSLKLNWNPISKFEIVSPVPTLKNLNLSYCQLGSIDESFNNIMSLERLVLDKNYFVSLPNEIGHLRRLEHFSIAHNSIGELPPEIGCLTELRVLDVRCNNLRKLPTEIWWANKLETLNASSNVLDHFPKPASRPPQPPGDSAANHGSLGSIASSSAPASQSQSAEDLSGDGWRRPSQASSTLLSVGASPVPAGPDRKNSVVSVYGKGGRKTSVMSRSTTGPTSSGSLTPTTGSRKDSSLSQRLTSTFAGSLRNLYLADNQLDDDVFDQITLLSELRVLNLSYNLISDMPQRSIKSWPQLVELYLSGNDLTSLPADDLEEYSLLQVLHINGNKFTNLPADISRAKKLAVLDCGSNYLKYNISNVPYDWNWNLNPNLRYLNLSGNRRLEIKQSFLGAGAANRENYTDFSRLQNLRVLGLMDVTLIQPSIPDQNEDRRVRTSGSIAGYLPYGMADTLGKNEHLSTIDLVVPRFNSSETETLLGLFDGQASSSGGSKIAKYLAENFNHVFAAELKALKKKSNETPEDALRRAFLSLNKDLGTIAVQQTEDRSLVAAHRGSSAQLVLSKEDVNSGAVATVAYLNGMELYVANVGDVQCMLIQADSTYKFLTRKHDPAEPGERSRIRDAGGWVSRNGRLNDMLDVSRAFGYVELMPAVQAAPNISHITIREQDETVLIATKELWNYVLPELAVDIARSERGDPMRASQKLRDLAMAYGASNKIMVMMISVADLKRRTERTRLHRGQSLSWYPMAAEDSQWPPARRGRRVKGEGPLDSTLQRLEAEVPAPTGMISIVFTDIKSSTTLWETYPAAMRSAIRLHNEVMRRQLRRIGGFEVKTEGDAFMVSFPTATSALLWCFAVQMQLLDVNWPSEMLNSVACQPLYDKDNNLIFKGLSVRMGIHWGEPLAEPDPVTRRMDYYGPMVNKASRISACADGGQITVSSDFISEIQRCLETYQESAISGEGGDGLDDGGDTYAKTIPNELRALSSQGFEVKEMGEKKLKGLENPEVVYSLYPHALAGRIEHHQAHERAQAAAASASSSGGGPLDGPVVLSPGSELPIDPEAIWALWQVSLRLEMLCSSLEEVSGRGLQPPETELLERIKQRGGEVTERFLVNFMEHQVSRIETCISTLTIRHMAMGGGPISRLSDLRAPMSKVLTTVAGQLQELQEYKARFGPLSDARDEGRVTELE